MWLNQECTRIGISISTALRWLISSAKVNGLVSPKGKGIKEG